MIEKTFINYQLGIKFNSYVDDKLNVFFFEEKMLLRYLDIEIQHKQ